MSMTPSEFKKSKEFISSCEVRRLEELENEFNAHEKFSEILKEKQMFSDKLAEALPDDLYKIFSQYCDVCLQETTERSRFNYMHSFMDATQLMAMALGNKQTINVEINWL